MKMTEKEQSLVAHVYTGIPLPPNSSITDYDHLDVHDFFYEKGTSYNLDL